MNVNSRSLIHRLTFIASTCAVLAMTLMAFLAQPAWALPPRPPGPELPDGVDSSSHAHIQLQVHFPANWPWQTVHWQDLWTVVQWQDTKGVWHTVAGWQGTLDEIKNDEDTTITGYKTWWLGAEHMGEGPFRWLVYQGKGGRLLAASASFDLPDIHKATLVVDVELVR